MNALVMGGTEFISKAVSKYLIEKGYKVDIFTRGVRKADYEGYRNHFKGDRKSLEDLSILSKEAYDYIFDISGYTKEDVEKLTSVLNKESIKRYVFCSSGAVYGESKKTLQENDERAENKHWGDYGLNKKLAEDYLFELYNKEGFPITIFRPSYIYGEGNNLYREGYFFERIINGFPIPVPKSNIKTQFIHIEDVVRAFESSIYIDEAKGQVYNLTQEELLTWNKLITTAMEVCNKKVTLVEIDEEKLGVETRSYFPFRNIDYSLSIEKLKKDGLYAPKISLLEGLSREVKWYLEEKPKLQDRRMIKIEEVLKG